ncbi:hypothetical protein AMS68_003830 [Peltaster fructicola]|uniref:SPX domain-containing protein n=1 Tax=Peltaster fructicola TaxID=286661 RepID=A0A6H0XUA9_9PEZI|nr:hypothetical protein AMS68_003830 [Peltaster fructicola]
MDKSWPGPHLAMVRFSLRENADKRRRYLKEFAELDEQYETNKGLESHYLETYLQDNVEEIKTELSKLWTMLAALKETVDLYVFPAWLQTLGHAERQQERPGATGFNDTADDRGDVGLVAVTDKPMDADVAGHAVHGHATDRGNI